MIIFITRLNGQIIESDYLPMRSFWKIYYDESARGFLDKPQIRLKTVNDAFIFSEKND